jgi:hypothetical protein
LSPGAPTISPARCGRRRSRSWLALALTVWLLGRGPRAVADETAPPAGGGTSATALTIGIDVSASRMRVTHTASAIADAAPATVDLRPRSDQSATHESTAPFWVLSLDVSSYFRFKGPLFAVVGMSSHFSRNTVDMQLALADLRNGAAAQDGQQTPGSLRILSFELADLHSGFGFANAARTHRVDVTYSTPLLSFDDLSFSGGAPSFEPNLNSYRHATQIGAAWRSTFRVSYTFVGHLGCGTASAGWMLLDRWFQISTTSDFGAPPRSGKTATLGLYRESVQLAGSGPFLGLALGACE